MSLNLFRSILWRRGSMVGLALLLAVAAPRVGADIEALARIKASYLLTFAKLTHWTQFEEASKDDQLTICTLASETLNQHLRTFTLQSVQGRAVRVVDLGLKRSSDTCHMVFVDEQHTQTWFRDADGDSKGQLVVGESPDFTQRGGVIRFYLEGDKLRFEVSLKNADIADVHISSRLLKLAKVVGGAS